MTPREKAIDLINSFEELGKDFTRGVSMHEFSKECALITVGKIIDALEQYDDLTEKYLKEEFGLEYFSCETQNMDGDFRYWDKVKTELQNL